MNENKKHSDVIKRCSKLPSKLNNNDDDDDDDDILSVS